MYSLLTYPKPTAVFPGMDLTEGLVIVTEGWSLNVMSHHTYDPTAHNGFLDVKMESSISSWDLCLVTVRAIILTITFCQLLFPEGRNICSEKQEKVA